MKLTKEHIWPDWYSQLREGERYVFDSTPRGQTKTSTRPSNGFDLAPKVLCPTCNHDWGSKLEGRVRPDLEPMTAGEGIVLPLLKMRRLATWVCLKVMVAEYLADSTPNDDPNDPTHSLFFQQAEREFLRNEGHPPKRVHSIWMGRYVGQRRDAGIITGQRLFLPFPEDPTTINDVLAETFVIGQAAFQLFAFHPYPRPGSREHEGKPWYFTSAEGDWDLSLQRIWPLPDEPVRWPPPHAFDDAGLQALAGRWNRDRPAGKPKDQTAS